jgi:hypothetical protein
VDLVVRQASRRSLQHGLPAGKLARASGQGAVLLV